MSSLHRPHGHEQAGVLVSLSFYPPLTLTHPGRAHNILPPSTATRQDCWTPDDDDDVEVGFKCNLLNVYFINIDTKLKKGFSSTISALKRFTMASNSHTNGGCIEVVN